MNKEEEPIEMAPENISFYYGADLSYVNEMEDCGAFYKNSNNSVQDPYRIFREAGTNLVRLRLWHTPDWTSYSNYDDVKKSIFRAKGEGMQVLLNFHYSDTWADPPHQQIPKAWENHILDTDILGDLLYNYTYTILDSLDKEGLMPNMVQIGNEINTMILRDSLSQMEMDWSRNAFLLNQGIKAVRDISRETKRDIGIMLHIAQPENAIWWFEQATRNGLTDFDWIGLSYYPAWSDYTLDNLSSALTSLMTKYNKKLMVVETAYPFTLENADGANNIQGENALLPNYPPTQQGQLDYLNTLKDILETSGAQGLVYWEPAWVSTNCNTLWGQGSHWDNATLFDHDSRPTLGIQFYNPSITE